MTRIAVIVLMLVATAPAGAERVTKMFPLSGSVPKTLRGAPGELTRVLAKELSAEVAATPIEDAAELVGCDVAMRACLQSIADKVRAGAIMFGHIERRGDGVVIKLTTFDPAKGVQQRDFLLTGETTDELVEALEKRFAPADPPVITDEPPATPTDKPQAASGHISTGTWALVITGGVAAVTGGGVLVSAVSLNNQIRTAPTATHSDIQQVQVMERAAHTRTMIGAGLLVGGGALAAIGIVRAVVQHRQPEQPLVDVVPEQGGASVFLNLRWK